MIALRIAKFGRISIVKGQPLMFYRDHAAGDSSAILWPWLETIGVNIRHIREAGLFLFSYSSAINTLLFVPVVVSSLQRPPLDQAGVC